MYDLASVDTVDIDSVKTAAEVAGLATMMVANIAIRTVEVEQRFGETPERPEEVIAAQAALDQWVIEAGMESEYAIGHVLDETDIRAARTALSTLADYMRALDPDTYGENRSEDSAGE